MQEQNFSESFLALAELRAKVEQRDEKPGSISERGNAWVANIIADAQAKANVSDTAVAEIKNELEGTMGQRALRPAELSALTKKLLDALSSSKPKSAK